MDSFLDGSSCDNDHDHAAAQGGTTTSTIHPSVNAQGWSGQAATAPFQGTGEFNNLSAGCSLPVVVDDSDTMGPGGTMLSMASATTAAPYSLSYHPGLNPESPSRSMTTIEKKFHNEGMPSRPFMTDDVVSWLLSPPASRTEGTQNSYPSSSTGLCSSISPRQQSEEEEEKGGEEVEEEEEEDVIDAMPRKRQKRATTKKEITINNATNRQSLIKKNATTPSSTPAATKAPSQKRGRPRKEKPKTIIPVAGPNPTKPKRGAPPPPPPDDSSSRSAAQSTVTTAKSRRPGGGCSNSNKTDTASSSGSGSCSLVEGGAPPSQPNKREFHEQHHQTKNTDNGGGGRRTTTTTTTADDKKALVRDRNREAARKCRLRKQRTVGILQDREAVADAVHTVLQGEISALKDEVLSLKNMVLQHSACGCHVVDEYIQQSATNHVNASVHRLSYGGGGWLGKEWVRPR